MSLMQNKHENNLKIARVHQLNFLAKNIHHWLEKVY